MSPQTETEIQKLTASEGASVNPMTTHQVLTDGERWEKLVALGRACVGLPLTEEVLGERAERAVIGQSSERISDTHRPAQLTAPATEERLVRTVEVVKPARVETSRQQVESLEANPEAVAEAAENRRKARRFIHDAYLKGPLLEALRQAEPTKQAKKIEEEGGNGCRNREQQPPLTIEKEVENLLPAVAAITAEPGFGFPASWLPDALTPKQVKEIRQTYALTRATWEHVPVKQPENVVRANKPEIERLEVVMAVLDRYYIPEEVPSPQSVDSGEEPSQARAAVSSSREGNSQPAKPRGETASSREQILIPGVSPKPDSGSEVEIVVSKRGATKKVVVESEASKRRPTETPRKEEQVAVAPAEAPKPERESSMLPPVGLMGGWIPVDQLPPNLQSQLERYTALELLRDLHKTGILKSVEGQQLRAGAGTANLQTAFNDPTMHESLVYSAVNKLPYSLVTQLHLLGEAIKNINNGRQAMEMSPTRLNLATQTMLHQVDFRRRDIMSQLEDLEISPEERRSLHRQLTELGRFQAKLEALRDASPAVAPPSNLHLAKSELYARHEIRVVELPDGRKVEIPAGAPDPQDTGRLAYPFSIGYDPRLKSEDGWGYVTSPQVANKFATVDPEEVVLQQALNRTNRLAEGYRQARGYEYLDTRPAKEGASIFSQEVEKLCGFLRAECSPELIAAKMSNLGKPEESDQRPYIDAVRVAREIADEQGVLEPYRDHEHPFWAALASGIMGDVFDQYAGLEKKVRHGAARVLTEATDTVYETNYRTLFDVWQVLELLQSRGYTAKEVEGIEEALPIRSEAEVYKKLEPAFPGMSYELRQMISHFSAMRSRQNTSCGYPGFNTKAENQREGQSPGGYNLVVFGPTGSGKDWMIEKLAEASGIFFFNASWPALTAAGHVGGKADQLKVMAVKAYRDKHGCSWGEATLAADQGRIAIILGEASTVAADENMRAETATFFSRVQFEVLKEMGSEGNVIVFTDPDTREHVMVDSRNIHFVFNAANTGPGQDKIAVKRMYENGLHRARSGQENLRITVDDMGDLGWIDDLVGRVDGGVSFREVDDEKIEAMHNGLDNPDSPVRLLYDEVANWIREVDNTHVRETGHLPPPLDEEVPVRFTPEAERLFLEAVKDYNKEYKVGYRAFKRIRAKVVNAIRRRYETPEAGENRPRTFWITEEVLRGEI